MKNILLSSVLSVVAFSAGAQDMCPAAPDVRNELLNLIARANAAENFSDGRRVSNQMWEVWLRAPDARAQNALDAGMRRRDVFDFAGAIEEFDRLAEYCPNYAEGFNQRAYIHYLSESYEEALVDLDIALGLQPYHVAAQSGRALTLMKLGRIAEARDQMLAAVENNPWLSEAALLAKGAPLGPVGDEI